MPPVLPRLSGEKNFKLIYRRGRRVSKHSLSVIYLHTPPTKTKIAVVVSKRVSHKAHQRNLYKRRLWGCLRELRKFLPANTLIIVLTKPTIKNLSYSQIKQDLVNILKTI